jgi:alpha-tubulin suppressor-like RCC1 family protein
MDGYGDCDGTPGCETKTINNRNHCGACGTTCAALCKGTACNDPVSIGGGYRHHCAILKDGDVYCWGRNEDGELGDGSVVSKTKPVKVALSKSALQVDGDAIRTCAVLADRTVACWGQESNTPKVVPSLANIKQIAVAINHMCAVDQVGKLYCWGDNGYGQLGTGNTTWKMFPAHIMSGVIQVCAGTAHTCAVKAGGTLQCWGSNKGGLLGTGSTTDEHSPTDVPGLTGVIEVGCGAGHTCARDVTAMSCWGANSSGQLGSGDFQDETTPQVVNLVGVQSIALGGNHTGAITEGGVFMWGSNSSGQLGNGTKTNATKPVAVKALGLVDAQSLGLSKESSCALTKPGEILCWGDNTYGQLGNGTTTSKSVPTPVVWP